MEFPTEDLGYSVTGFDSVIAALTRSFCHLRHFDPTTPARSEKVREVWDPRAHPRRQGDMLGHRGVALPRPVIFRMRCSLE